MLMSVVSNYNAYFISEAEKCPITCGLCFLCLSVCANVSRPLPELVLKGLKCTWEFRCLCGTLVGVPLDLMDILACFVCLFLFVYLCTVFHSHCSILYPHIFLVYSVPAFPCCLVILAISLLAIHTPLWRGVLTSSIYFQLRYLLPRLISRRPLFMLEMNQLPGPTGVNDAC